jgi:hypothetical protein
MGTHRKESRAAKITCRSSGSDRGSKEPPVSQPSISLVIFFRGVACSNVGQKSFDQWVVMWFKVVARLHNCVFPQQRKMFRSWRSDLKRSMVKLPLSPKRCNILRLRPACAKRVFIGPRATSSTQILQLTIHRKDATLIQAPGTLLPTSESAPDTRPRSLDVPGNRYNVIPDYNCSR